MSDASYILVVQTSLNVLTMIGQYTSAKPFHSSEVREPPAGAPTSVGKLATHDGISN